MKQTDTHTHSHSWNNSVVGVGGGGVMCEVNQRVSYRCSVMPMSLSSLTDSRGEMMSCPNRSYINTCRQVKHTHTRGWRSQ